MTAYHDHHHNSQLMLWPVTCHGLAEQLSALSKKGQVKINSDQYVYLDIDDDYIHRAMRAINDDSIRLPSYFDDQTDHIGAHISIIYPEEGIRPDDSEAGLELTFDIGSMFYAELEGKGYYALGVNCPEIILLRDRHALPDMLCLHGYEVPPHITVAIKDL